MPAQNGAVLARRHDRPQDRHRSHRPNRASVTLRAEDLLLLLLLLRGLLSSTTACQQGKRPEGIIVGALFGKVDALPRQMRRPLRCVGTVDAPVKLPPRRRCRGAFWQVLWGARARDGRTHAARIVCTR
jgi:hypothetical protein